MIQKIVELFNLFEKQIKNKILLTQILLVVSAIFEILSIFSIGPLIQILSNPEIIYDKDQFVSKIYNYFNFSSFKNFLIFVVMSIFIFLLFSTLILTYSIYFISIFSAKLGQILRNNLYKYYISQDWLFHTKSNTSEYLTKISTETSRVSNSIILQVLLMNAKIITGIFIIISLTIYNPLTSAICFLFFGIIYYGMFKIVKSRVYNHGLSQSETQKKMFKVLSESLGIKEIIIFGIKRKFFQIFSKIGNKHADSSGKITFLGTAPRYTLEFLAVSIVISFIFFLVFYSNNNFMDTLPVLAIYIFAGYKLLPIFQQIYFSLTQIKSAIPALDRIKVELGESKNYEIDNQEENKNKSLFSYNQIDSISLNNVLFYYDNVSKKVIENFNLNINKNSFSFIIGSSGSGKSTILDLLLGLLRPKKGEIWVGKEKLTLENSYFWHQNLSYVGQNIFLFDDTIKNNICFNVNNDNAIDEKKLEIAVKDSCVENFLHDLPKGLDTIVGEGGTKLSGGQKQRVALARAFYQDKKIIILDEATSSLDGIIEKSIIQTLKTYSNSKTIIMVTHNVKLCIDADMIFLLDKGKVVDSGKYLEIKNNELYKKLLNEV